VPTLLHFAAHFGMNDFASDLLKMNAAGTVNCIANIDNKFPSDMAKFNSHNDLADMLASVRDLVRKSL
jgi:ankyrin repeat protein